MNYYLEAEVQERIEQSLKRIHGTENKDDARQSAYEAICDEYPSTIPDACDCASKAIERFRNKLRRVAKYETGIDADLIPDTRYMGYDYSRIPYNPNDYGSDAIPIIPGSIDKELFTSTDVCPDRGPAYYKQALRDTAKMCGDEKARFESAFEKDKRELREKLDSGYFVTMCRKPEAK